MTLKEKFLPKMYCFMGSGMLINLYDEKVAEDNAKECEVIADDFAIGFAEWFTNEQSPYSIMNGNQEKRFSDFRKDYTIKELLEIYKKDKGL